MYLLKLIKESTQFKFAIRFKVIVLRTAKRCRMARAWRVSEGTTLRKYLKSVLSLRSMLVAE
ncbi:hypothetical protein EYF80_024073 [Liparis tanakae]|uniref:Uncharacterized protein n=1 Tax=Liparis tanakae TaxID=230148 RepID=A0A4Z2HIC5_9TELE|nr:hypothetical protein EYF80_024073 [Liparis tanakae]